MTAAQRPEAKAAKPRSMRNDQLGKIHIAAKQLGMDDSTYRDMLWSIGRVRSAKDLDLAGREAVLKHLAACGWKNPRPSTSARSPYSKGSRAALIRHLWTRLAQAGQVQDGTDAALRAFVRNQSAPHHPAKTGWDHPNLLPTWVAGKVIEHLKQWCERAGVER
ncbi:regulatory protein GemA [Luteibacter anthropi]|uniref:gp16 family protein n=1 Tax=Luteibacter anthropi TaxID=564369 RepID=UPI0020327905|nr:regulatory protein GemA [Luteibacter anthropi]URX63294.1 regulatory protein GemA [Luteibacter anthropi]